MLLSATSNGVGVNVRLVGYGLSVSRYQGIYRDASQRESLRAGKGSSFDDNDYMGDLTPTLRPMTQVNLVCLKLGQTFPQG